MNGNKYHEHVDNKMYSKVCFTHLKMKCWVFPLGVIVPYSLLFSCPPFFEHPWNLVLTPSCTPICNKDGVTKMNNTMGQSCMYSPIHQG
jgi:hypothetical protein